MDYAKYGVRAYPEVTEGLLAEIVRRIKSVGDPLKIVLFGSRARGDYKPDSDIDILVIEEESDPSRMKSIKYNAALRDLYPEKTVVVYGRRAVEDWKNVPAHILTVALAQGRVLYDSGQYGDRKGGLEHAGRVAESPGDKTPGDLAQLWFEKGNGDIRAARQLLKGENCYDGVCFHAQQAVEKYLKGFLAFNNIVADKTHDLDALARQCLALQPIAEPDVSLLAKLTPYAVKARYDFEFSPSLEEAKKALTVAERVAEITLAQMPP